MQLTLNIPDFAPLTLNKDIQELKQTIKLNTALMLFKNAKFSIEQASKFANLSLYDFMGECKKNQIPVISYEADELANEMKLMSGMILIADSSALVALSIVDKLDVLEKLFGEVYVPRAVYEEVSQENKAESYKLKVYCQERVLDIESNANFNITLGKGESEAIVLYREQNADFLLCDDKKAKKFAQSFGLKDKIESGFKNSIPLWLFGFLR